MEGLVHDLDGFFSDSPTGSSGQAGELTFVEMDTFLVSRVHIREISRELQALGIQYMGLCCGAMPYMRGLSLRDLTHSC